MTIPDELAEEIRSCIEQIKQLERNRVGKFATTSLAMQCEEILTKLPHKEMKQEIEDDEDDPFS